MTLWSGSSYSLTCPQLCNTPLYCGGQLVFALGLWDCLRGSEFHLPLGYSYSGPLLPRAFTIPGFHLSQLRNSSLLYL